MINYSRTEWYGVSYLFSLGGSVLPRCMPMVVMAGMTAGLFAALDWHFLWDFRKYFGHPYALQLLGLVFGYLSVSRLQVSYNRYWEGCTNVKIMYESWADACLQTLANDAVPHTYAKYQRDPFCAYIVRLFSQMSAMAMLKLHLEEDWDRVHEMLTHPPAANPKLVGRGGGLLTSKELELLMRLPEPVSGCASRITRAITTRQRAGGVSAPPPQVSRIFQELSDGVRGYHECLKMKDVPVPFAYVQVNALLLLFFNAVTPIAVAVFSSADYATAASDNYSGDPNAPAVDEDSSVYSMGARIIHVVVSVGLSAFVVCGFTAMWMVANELEDPFGEDGNDLDVLDYHIKFCEQIDSMLDGPWLEEDHWTVAEGEWKKAEEDAPVEPQRRCILRRPSGVWQPDGVAARSAANVTSSLPQSLRDAQPTPVTRRAAPGRPRRGFLRWGTPEAPERKTNAHSKPPIDGPPKGQRSDGEVPTNGLNLGPRQLLDNDTNTNSSSASNPLSGNPLAA